MRDKEEGTEGESVSEGKTIWVTGAKGFVGSELVARLEQRGYTVAATDDELSVGDPERLEAFAVELRPDVIVNCAAIPREATGLTNRIKAYEVNALGARNMAVVAAQVGALLVQVSTDDVYPVRMAEAANEFDAPHPETPYGKSKRAGEVMVRDTMSDYLIVRTSWLYGSTGGMVKRALDAAKEGRTIEGRTDQFASPTSITSYVDFLIKAIEKRATGVLHITSKGVVSRYEFMAKVLELCGYEPGKVLVPKSDLVTSEQVLLESLMLEMFGADLPNWEDDLKAFLEEAGLAK